MSIEDETSTERPIETSPERPTETPPERPAETPPDQPTQEHREKKVRTVPPEDEIERLFGSLPAVRVSRLERTEE